MSFILHDLFLRDKKQSNYFYYFKQTGIIAFNQVTVLERNRNRVLRYITRRVLLAIPTLLAVTVIGFVLMRFHIDVGPLRLGSVTVLPRIAFKQPIDPLAELRQNPQISAEALAKEERRLGLNQPLWKQYGLWLSHALRGDLGTSASGEPVLWLLANKAGNTLLLNVITLLVTWLVALPVGVWAAVHARTLFDRGLTLLSSVGMALPSFVLALLLGVWAIQTGWLPFGGLTSAHFSQLSPLGKVLDVAAHLVLPVTVLSIGGMASLQRQMRGNLLEVLGAEYVKMAHAKGLPHPVVLYKHAVRNAINPLTTLLGYEFAALLSGAILVETVLGYPGLGYLTYQAALQADVNVVMATLVLSSALLVAGNLFADLLLHWVDPRIEDLAKGGA